MDNLGEKTLLCYYTPYLYRSYDPTGRGSPGVSYWTIRMVPETLKSS